MSSTVEVARVRKHSRTRFLVLIPLVPALMALAFVASVPLSSVNADTVAQSLPATVLQPAAAPAPATPAITASPSPSAAVAALFAAPPITVLPPPPPPPAAKRSSGHSSGGHSSAGCSSGATYGAYECANFGFLNDDRAAAGVAALAWSSSLANTARSWATYLADNDVTGSAIHHSTIWTNGENIYWISGGSGSALADRANTAFMNSTDHRANLLRPTFHSVGVGIAQSSTGGWYVVQDFSN
jgi:uncharacterized protein YkwD